MGLNSEAQLGRGHARTVAGPDVVKTMQDKVTHTQDFEKSWFFYNLSSQFCDDAVPAVCGLYYLIIFLSPLGLGREHGLLRGYFHGGRDHGERPLLLGDQVYQSLYQAKHQGRVQPELCARGRGRRRRRWRRWVTQVKMFEVLQHINKTACDDLSLET